MSWGMFVKHVQELSTVDYIRVQVASAIFGKRGTALVLEWARLQAEQLPDDEEYDCEGYCTNDPLRCVAGCEALE